MQTAKFDKHRRGFPSILNKLEFPFAFSHEIVQAWEAAPKHQRNRLNKNLKRMILSDYRHFTSTLYNSFTLNYFREESFRKLPLESSTLSCSRNESGRMMIEGKVWHSFVFDCHERRKTKISVLAKKNRFICYFIAVGVGESR